MRNGLIAVMGGAATSQLILVAVSPLLTRLYTPEDIGLLSVVVALIAVSAPVLTLRFDLAVPIPRSDDDARALAVLAMSSGVLLSALLAVCAAQVAPHLDPALASWLWAVPAGALLLAWFAALNQLAIREQRYGAVATRNALQAGVTALTQVVLGVVTHRPGGLVAGLLVGQAMGVASLAMSLRLRFRWFLSLRHGASWGLVSRYRRFPLVLTPSAVLNTLGQHAPLLLVAGLYGPAVAGWLGLTQRVLAVPLTVIGVSTAQVFVGELAHRLRSRDASPVGAFRSATWRLTAVAVPAGLALALLAPSAFVVVFGESWRTSGEYAQLLVPLFASQLVASPTSQTLVVLERTGTQFFWDATRVIAVTAAVLTVYQAGGSAANAILAYSLVGTTTYVALLALSWRALRRHHISSRTGATGTGEPEEGR